jgi:hypothetical protein
VRGIALRHINQNGVVGSTFTGLISDTPPENSEFIISSETREASFLSFLKDDLGATSITVGHFFKNEATNHHYRIARIHPRASDISTVFECETSTITP